MRITVFLAAMMALSLGACGNTSEQAPPTKEAQANSAAIGPEAKPGLSLSEGKLMLPPVSGRPGAAYFVVRNDWKEAVTLVAVHIDGAEKTEMHETKGGTMSPIENLVLASGKSLHFKRGGLHVMAFGLSDTLKPGGSTEITLTFADGDKVSAPVAIESAAGGMAH